MVKKKGLVQDIDDMDFEADKTDNEIEYLDDVSEEELQEIEELVDTNKKSKNKKSKKAAKSNDDDFDDDFDEIKPKKVKKKKNKTKSKPKVVKKTTKPDKKKSDDVQYTKGIFALIVVIVVLAVLLAVGFNAGWFKSSKNNEGVAVYVNGVPISTDLLSKRFDQMSQASFTPITEELVLDKLIEQELIKQKAEELGIEIPMSEVEAELNDMLEQRGITRDQLEQNLEMSGMTLEELLDDFKNFILLEHVANATFKSEISATNSDLINYFSNKVLVRHILLISEEENQELYNQLNDIKSGLEADDKDFCDVVTEISQDTGSVSNCGRYTFARGEMVEEFEDASFLMDINEMDIVKTQYGYHLIQRLTIDEEARKDAEQMILSVKSNDAYLDFIDNLKNDSKIIIISDGNSDDSGFEIDDESAEDIIDIIESETNGESDVEYIEEEILETLIIEDDIDDDSDVVIIDDDAEDIIDIIESETNRESDVEYVEEYEEEEISEPVLINEDFEKPLIKFFYSETDDKSKEIGELLIDLVNSDYIEVEWSCIRVNSEDKDFCIDLYGEYLYEIAMAEARELGLKYAPTIFIDGEEYSGSYEINLVEEAICMKAGC